MITKTTALIAAAVAGAAIFACCIGPHSAHARSVDDYSVADLLSPCVEGDNDSRGGAVLELECEQYINGFTDIYIRMGGPKADNVCLPNQNASDEIRWAFMRWAHENFSDRKQPAVDGIRKTLKAYFMCK